MEKVVSNIAAFCISCLFCQLATGGGLTDSVSASAVTESVVASYFDEVISQTENGDIAFFPRRWLTDIRVVVHGDPGQETLEVLNQVLSELNELIAPLTLRIVGANGNVDLYFAPVSEFRNILPQYRAYNPGFHWVWWDDRGVISAAVVLVSTTRLSQNERHHVLREELTQSLGILNDSNSYPDSIFYRGWSDVTSFSALDQAVIQRLYSSELLLTGNSKYKKSNPSFLHQD